MFRLTIRFRGFDGDGGTYVGEYDRDFNSEARVYEEIERCHARGIYLDLAEIKRVIPPHHILDSSFWKVNDG